MALKRTVRRNRIPVRVEWQDSEWDLEVTVLKEFHGLNELHRLHGADQLQRVHEEGSGCVRIWRCGLGHSRFPLTPTLSPSDGEREERGRCLKPARRIERLERLKSGTWRLPSKCGNGLPTGMPALRGGIMKNKFMSGRHHRRAFTLIELL